MNIEDFILRKDKEELRNAIMLSSVEFKENLPKLLKHAHERLIEWAGEYSYRYGYNVKDADFEVNTACYGTEIGIGIFLQCEKYDDVRGLLLTAYQNANDLKEENEELKRRNNFLNQELKEEQEKNKPIGGGLFDRFYEGKAVTDEE